MKMAVPTFNGENFDMFAKNAMMYAKLLKFDLVFTTQTNALPYFAKSATVGTTQAANALRRTITWRMRNMP